MPEAAFVCPMTMRATTRRTDRGLFMMEDRFVQEGRETYPRFSRFNKVVREKGYVLVANLFTGATYAIDRAMADIFESRAVDKLTPDQQADLAEKGLLILDRESDCELEQVEYMHLQEKFASRWLNVTLLLTMGCNLRCVYCYEGAGIVSSASITPDGYERVYRFITDRLVAYRMRGISLCLFGGEPWLQLEKARFFLGRLKAFCGANGMEFSTMIVTNGTLVDDNGIELLKQVNCRTLQVTLDGTREVHDRRRVGPKGEGSFEATLAGIEKLAASGLPKPVIRINVDKTNIESVRPLLRELKARSLEGCPVDFGIVKGNTEHCTGYECHCFCQEEVGDCLERLWAIGAEEGFDVGSYPGQKFTFCGMMGDQAYTVCPDLKVYKCWDFVNNPHHCIGEIDGDGDLVNLTPAFYRWMTRNPLTMELCRDCAYLPVCGGGCGGMCGSEDYWYRTPCCFKIKGVVDKEIIARFEGKLKENPALFKC